MTEASSNRDVFFQIPEIDTNFKSWDFVGDVLDIQVDSLYEPAEFYKGDKRYFIPSGTVLGEVAYFSMESSVSGTLSKGINDLNDFFQKLDSLETIEASNQIPKILWGSTHKRLIRFSSRLGFEEVRSSDFFDDDSVIAPVHVVRDNFNKLMSKVNVDAIKLRANRSSTGKRRFIKQRGGKRKSITFLRS